MKVSVLRHKFPRNFLHFNHEVAPNEMRKVFTKAMTLSKNEKSQIHGAFIVCKQQAELLPPSTLLFAFLTIYCLLFLLLSLPRTTLKEIKNLLNHRDDHVWWMEDWTSTLSACFAPSSISPLRWWLARLEACWEMFISFFEEIFTSLNNILSLLVAELLSAKAPEGEMMNSRIALTTNEMKIEGSRCH